MKVWWVTPTLRAYKRPSAGRNVHTQETLLLSFSTREQPQQATPAVWLLRKLLWRLPAVEATAMEAWAVAMAPATALASAGWAVAMAVAMAMAPASLWKWLWLWLPLSVEVAMDAALAMALALATTIEDATKDSHPLYLVTRIHQF